jgi:hypothetical protein
VNSTIDNRPQVTELAVGAPREQEADVASATATVAPATQLLRQLYAEAASTTGTVNLTVACEELPAPWIAETEKFISYCLASKRPIHIRCLSQTVREAKETLIPAAMLEGDVNVGDVARGLVAQVGATISDQQILRNLLRRAVKNKRTQDQVKAWKRRIRSAGRIDTASFAYRAHGLSPLNDVVILDIDDPAAMRRQCQMVMMPRQSASMPETWYGIRHEGDMGLVPQTKATIEVLWASGNDSPKEINHRKFLEEMVPAWREFRNDQEKKIEMVIKEEWPLDYRWILGLQH